MEAKAVATTWEIRESRGEELANSLLHGLGVALSVAGLSVMVVMAAMYGDAWHVVASAIYGSSLVLLYLCSTLYHAFPWPRAKRVFEVFDHSAIYVLIAGTYTPFTLVSLRGPTGWTVFGIVWGLAALGITMQAVFPGRWRGLMTAMYVAMGLICVPFLGSLSRAMGTAGVAWLLGGGIAYIAGVYFYYRKRFDYSHAVWHVFVLAGSVCHFFGILFHVLPQA